MSHIHYILNDLEPALKGKIIPYAHSSIEMSSLNMYEPAQNTEFLNGHYYSHDMMVENKLKADKECQSANSKCVTIGL